MKLAHFALGRKAPGRNEVSSAQFNGLEAAEQGFRAFRVMSAFYSWSLAVGLSGLTAALLIPPLWRGRKERARLEEFARGLLLAHEAERKRMAAGIHDGLGQNLLIINSRASLALAPGADSATMTAQLGEISKVCLIAIEEARQIARSLGPAHLEALGLNEALEAMIARVADSTALKFTHRLEPVDEIFSPETATSIYRITQEALNNVMKHAGASAVRVDLIRDVRNVCLTIQDDGRGLRGPPNGHGSHAQKGLGLAQISERVRMLGGAFQITSEPAKGTALRVTIPLREGARV